MKHPKASPLNDEEPLLLVRSNIKTTLLIQTIFAVFFALGGVLLFLNRWISVITKAQSPLLWSGLLLFLVSLLFIFSAFRGYYEIWITGDEVSLKGLFYHFDFSLNDIKGYAVSNTIGYQKNYELLYLGLPLGNRVKIASKFYQNYSEAKLQVTTRLKAQNFLGIFPPKITKP